MHNVQFKADFTAMAMLMLMLMFMISIMVKMVMTVFISFTGLPDYYRVWLPASARSTHN
jgi:hypothetical protein